MNQPWVYMCSPSWNPSHLPPHSIPQGHPSAPALNTLSHALNLNWWSMSHMVIYMFQCYSLKSFYPHLLPESKSLFFCLYVTHLYSFLCWWIFSLFPCLGYYKLCCNKHWGAWIFSNYGFFPDICPGVGLLDHMVSTVKFFKEPPYCSPQWLYQFTFPRQCRGFPFSTLSPAFTVCRFFDDGHSYQCKVIPHKVNALNNKYFKHLKYNRKFGPEASKLFGFIVA